MRSATLLPLLLMALLVSSGPSLSAPAGRATLPQTQAPAQPRAPAAPVAEEEDEAPAAAGRTASPRPGRTGERRRRSYASCNRESHRRNMRGGGRRRFLIRCRLGYEPRQPPRASTGTQPSQPQPAGKRP